MLNKIWYMTIFLGIVGAIAGASLAGVKAITDPIIEKRIIEEGIKPSLDKFLGEIGVENDPIADRIKIDLGRDDRGRKMELTVFKAMKSGSVAAAALQTASSGYGGDIDVLTVFDLGAKKILGVKTLSQKETKGLGARVSDDTEPFIKQFVNMSFANGVKLSSDGGEVDAISVATSPSTALANAVVRAVILLGEHSDRIANA